VVVGVKRTIEQALRDVGQEVAQQLVAGHGDVRQLELAGMDTAEEPLECVDTDRRTVGLIYQLRHGRVSCLQALPRSGRDGAGPRDRTFRCCSLQRAVAVPDQKQEHLV
jgi:hypothetical protein